MEAARTNAWLHPVFRRYQVARIFTVLSLQVQGVAVGWQVYSLTGNPMDLGWVGLAQFLPTMVLWPLVGAVVDGFDRRNVLMACWVAIGLGAFGLAWADYTGIESMPVLYGLLFLGGLARAFSSPTAQSMLPQLVPAEVYPNAVTWSSSVFQLGSVAGPALGGAIFAMLGVAWKVYAVSGAMALAGAALLVAIPAPGRPGVVGTRSSAFDGMRFVVSRPVMLAAISLDLVAVLFGGVVALLPIYARDMLGGGPDTLGWLRAAPAAGATATAIFLGRFPIQNRAGRKMLWSVVVFGLATVAFSVSTSLAVSMACMFVAGVADEVSVVIRHCIVQLSTPNEMRGRVSAVNFLFVSVSNELGQFESGLAAAYFGLVPAAAAGGVVAIVAAGITALAVPALRRYDKLGG